MNRPTILFLGGRRRAILTVIGWLLLVGVLAGIAPDISSVEDNGSANSPSADSASIAARAALDHAFPGSDTLPAVAVIRAATPASAATAAADLARAVAASDLPEQVEPAITAACTPAGGLAVGTDCVPAAPTGIVSKDGTQLVVLPIHGDPADTPLRDTVDALRALAARVAAEAPASASVDIAVTGPAGIVTDTTKVFGESDRTLLFGTIALVLAILLAVYRSPLLALLPLLAVGVAMQLAQAIGALLADAGAITLSSQTTSIMTVLLFGVGTDYALVITARYREALRTETDHLAAMRTALARTAESVLSSAATIVLAMLALLVAVSPALRGFGPYLALGVASMALVAFTFLPAAIALCGRAVFWPSSRSASAARSEGSRWWRHVAATVTAAPRRTLAATLAVLAVLGLGMIGYKESFDFVSGFRTATESERGQTMIRADFGPGEIAPGTLLVTGDGMTTGRAADIAAAIVATRPDDVARTAFAAPTGARPSRDISADGRSARITVVSTVDPYANAALDAGTAIRDAARTAAENAGVTNVEVAYGGVTATAADLRTDLDRDLLVLIPLVVVLVGLVLGVLLRSVLAPLYLMATLVLSFVATMGVTVLVTVTLLGDTGIGNRVTAYTFVFLVALGVDYTIFMMSRYRQELAHREPAAAMTRAIERTGGVISSAGLILAGTFAVLMTQPIRELFQFGFAMAVGILLDTFVVRPLLVPAIVRLLDDRALWPHRAPEPEEAPEAEETAEAEEAVARPSTAS